MSKKETFILNPDSRGECCFSDKENDVVLYLPQRYELHKSIRIIVDNNKKGKREKLLLTSIKRCIDRYGSSLTPTDMLYAINSVLDEE